LYTDWMNDGFLGGFRVFGVTITNQQWRGFKSL